MNHAEKLKLAVGNYREAVGQVAALQEQLTAAKATAVDAENELIRVMTANGKSRVIDRLYKTEYVYNEKPHTLTVQSFQGEVI